MLAARSGTTSCPNIPFRVRRLVEEAAQTLRADLGEEARILWFAAWTRGEARWHSPIELAVQAPALLDPKALPRAQKRLETLETLYSFQLTDLDQVSARRRARIEGEGITL